MGRLKFELKALATGSRARAARMETLHGEVLTPVFMPVGTQATVKSQTLETLVETGSQVLLANTYHLLLRPGPEVFRKMGGIHPFMKWDKPVLTDSGGFQIFSLPHSREITEEGAQFKSYIDGKLIRLSPESSIEMQRAIGSDIMMVLDQCVDSTSDRKIVMDAMDLTHRWARRSLKARGDSPQSLFAIVQGACFGDLRRQSAENLTQLDFDGFAIGGLAVGEGKALREDMTALTTDLLPQNLPRYLMGVGTPIDLLEGVHRGVDMFDCIIPTALAQRGVAFTSCGKIQLRRSVYKFSEAPLDPACACMTCKTYSQAYLHHLVKSEEVLGWHLIGLHNLKFYHQLMDEIRASILEDKFRSYYEAKRKVLEQADPLFPVQQQRRTRSKKKGPFTLGDYEVHFSSGDFASIRQKSSGEVMHSVNHPQVEARKLYVEQSHFAEKIQDPDLPEWVIWDVGLGAATNAMSFVSHYESQSENAGTLLRKVHVVSFENDLDSLKLALKNVNRFPYLKHPAPHHLINDGRWNHKTLPLRWTLLEGDFLETLSSAPIPDLICYDPFSYKTNSKLWELSCFQKIFRRCQNHPAELLTYSASTSVRAALLAAGFYVAQGVESGPKSETTIALILPPQTPTARKLLPADWLIRWSRSGSPYPINLGEAERQNLREKIVGHNQFGK